MLHIEMVDEEREVFFQFFSYYFNFHSFLKKFVGIVINEPESLSKNGIGPFFLTSTSSHLHVHRCCFSLPEIPCFYMNGHRALSGAQETETFVKTFDIIAQKEPLDGPIEGLIDV